ncbi:MAG: thiamine pyrophosphate-dependent enzyme [Bacillota bacterium]|jgi:indolepyruvate ferredoxin oxidoreductase alpha subunit
MTKKMVLANEAVAYAALRAGVKVVSGYPGTPSSEVIMTLLKMKDLDGTKVEWSTNEKVAFEVAAAASWAGHRAMCTMKMSGLNVAYDSVIGVAYSGCTGGLVIYVTDDPGVTTGMAEQDTRGFALMSDMPMLEPGSVEESYELTKFAFELSEAIKSPVFVRSVTNVAQSHGVVDIEERVRPDGPKPLFEKNISKYTKAGAAICMAQHRELIKSLAQAGKIIEEKGLNKLNLAPEKGGLGIISVGVVNGYLEEGLEIANKFGLSINPVNISTLRLVNTVPFPAKEVGAILDHCDTVLVLEELEPHLEKAVYLEAYKKGVKVKIVGKEDGTLSRIGSYDATHVAKGLFSAMGQLVPESLSKDFSEGEKKAAARPITTCAGCPHRGTFMSINKALKNLKLKKEEVMVTGDIGCTILGMNPPFHTLWTEVSMGASIPLAQGFVYSELETPVIATIGDSTFFHAGIPALINAIQHGINLTVIIMDNGWTAMTGMQVNPGTHIDFQQPGYKQLDLVKVVEGLGVEKLYVVDPYNLEMTTKAIEEALKLPGVKVVMPRRECAIQANRRKIKYSTITVDEEKCNLCKLCVTNTGCPAITLGEKSIVIDPAQCNGCGICAQVCNRSAIVREVE